MKISLLHPKLELHPLPQHCSSGQNFVDDPRLITERGLPFLMRPIGHSRRRDRQKADIHSELAVYATANRMRPSARLWLANQCECDDIWLLPCKAN